MNRGSFIKGLFGIGTATLLPYQSKSNTKSSFNKALNVIDKKSALIYSAFLNKDISMVSKKDYEELVEAYDIFLEEFLDEEKLNGSDIHFKKGAFSKIKYHLLNKDIKSSDDSFNKYFGDYHKMLRLHFNKLNDNTSVAILYREYANHLLYFDYVQKAKTKILNFKQFCNDYALKNMKDKKIWFSVENDSYNGGYKFRNNF